MIFTFKVLLNQAVNQPAIVSRKTEAPIPGSSIDMGGLLKQFSNPEGLLTIGGLIFILLVLRFVGGGKGKITTGKVCGVAEKLAATQLALKQIKERKHNKVCLWCGSPRYWWKGKNFKGMVATVQTAIGAIPTIWIPHAERSILVIGAPGSGKTVRFV